jgi:hypothetical protein
MLEALAEITDYDSLIQALRARANELSISRETIDNLAGLPDRYANKVLSTGGRKRIGMQSLGLLLGALGLKLIAVPDEEALARNRSRMVPRQEFQVRNRGKRKHRAGG